jgi:hypothetical protein
MLPYLDMADLKIGDIVRHRFNSDAVGEIIEVRTTSNREFRLIRVRWTTGPVLDVTWETEEDLTIAE